jgi:hypothetical protein
MRSKLYRGLSVLCFVVVMLSLVPVAGASDDDDGCNWVSVKKCKNECPTDTPRCWGTGGGSNGDVAIICPQCTAT